MCGTWLSRLFLGNNGAAPSGLFDEKADTLLVLRAMSGFVMDNGGVAKLTLTLTLLLVFDVDAAVGAAAFMLVALARSCASAEPLGCPTALGVTRFFLEQQNWVSQCCRTGRSLF